MPDSGVCEQLISEIRTTSQGNGSQDLHTVLQEAATAIQIHGQDFAPQPLSDLIETALDAATQYSSSADALAALELIDAVQTHLFLPVSSTRSVLPAVVRFLAFTYHQGSRAYRLQKLTQQTWLVTEHLLQSHLGELPIYALLNILEDDSTASDPRTGFSYTLGALMLISDNLLSRSDSLPTVNLKVLLGKISKMKVVQHEMIRDQVSSTLDSLLHDDEQLDKLRRGGYWEEFLGIAHACAKASPQSPSILALHDSLMNCVDKIQPFNYVKMSQLCIDLDRPLPPPVQEEFLASWKSEVHVPWSEEHKQRFQQLCKSAHYEAVIVAIMSAASPELADLLSQESFTVLLKYLQDIVMTTEFETSADAIGQGLVRAFLDVLIKSVDWKCIALFKVLCEICDRSSPAAELLFCFRADVRGEIYLARLLDLSIQPHKAFGGQTWNLSIDVWHCALMSVFQQGTKWWGVYDIFLCRLPSLMGNHRMFKDRGKLIRRLVGNVCDQVEKGTYQHPPPSSPRSRPYVVAQLIHLLSILASYHRHLEKHEMRRVIWVFINTAGSGDHNVSRMCINALIVCCYDIPSHMKNYIDVVIDKMSKMVTQRQLAVHVLLFLSGLSRQRDLMGNFRREDYKRVFGVCFSYLKSIWHVQSIERKAESQYVFTLAHHIIAFWYLTLPLQDRGALRPYIVSSLTYKEDGEVVVGDQGLVTMDLMDRVDADLDMDEFHATLDTSDSLIMRHRLCGLLLITIRTSDKDQILVTVRRPSGDMERIIHDDEQIRLTTCGDETTILAVPEQGTHGGSITLPSPSSFLGSEVVELVPSDGLTRAIQTFDRTSALDSHKAGVLYMKAQQITAESILSNTSGSAAYEIFISRLGESRPLQDARWNTQGLDRSSDALDGTHTMVWSNAVAAMVFHIPTLMPNETDPAQNVAKKKRHIGNDNVNIVFNESGIRLNYNLLYNIFPGDVTHVYIVITPAARESKNHDSDDILVEHETFYGVQVYSCEGFPSLSAAEEERVVSATALASLVRSLAFTLCFLSLMWMQQNEAEYPSSWRSRLQQLRKMGERFTAK
ncbi:hypothetical protein K470DRAFT_257099 [Piedraia hortae CBS 480.64]|uniref:Rap-GAP domain-containing protein n=1 Tax=Piedraia hortae CBS 480.64 TaxID=1314780 RepID=A0A6A7C157_9PEZI|nr:hypothetical protein K470DRAFT_257099 [Piedraia hortae CBS 480.64]